MELQPTPIQYVRPVGGNPRLSVSGVKIFSYVRSSHTVIYWKLQKSSTLIFQEMAERNVGDH